MPIDIRTHIEDILNPTNPGPSLDLSAIEDLQELYKATVDKQKEEERLAKKEALGEFFVQLIQDVKDTEEAVIAEMKEAKSAYRASVARLQLIQQTQNYGLKTKNFFPWLKATGCDEAKDKYMKILGLTVVPEDAYVVDEKVFNESKPQDPNWKVVEVKLEPQEPAAPKTRRKSKTLKGVPNSRK